MSAMGAAELPEVPAALPQDSPRNRAAARWAGAAEVAPIARPERLPVPATRPETPHGLAPRPRLAPDQAARNQTARVPLRLTRRGRVVVAVATALLLAVLSLVIAASAQATSHSAPSGAAQRNLAQVTVRPGQSLWSVAENADPNADTRVVVQQIIELNGLTGNLVFAGQRLWVPRG
jgi:LysM domain